MKLIDYLLILRLMWQHSDIQTASFGELYIERLKRTKVTIALVSRRMIEPLNKHDKIITLNPNKYTWINWWHYSL